MTPLLPLAALAVSLLAAPAAGVVFDDRDADGVRDPGERGIAGVAVSDGDTVAHTDAAGAFRLSAARGPVFVSVPDGFRVVGAWWHPAEVAADGPLTFALSAAPRPATFTFVHASDPHLAPASVPRTRRLRVLVDSLRPAFLLLTGDLVRDALRVPEAEATGYFELLGRELGAFATPVHTVPGNHDVFGVERDKSGVATSHPLYGRRMYWKYRGPDHYSFTHGGVHFVALNTVDVADQSYHGHVDSAQLAWLERDLARLPADASVVTFSHIPLLSASEQLHGYDDGPPAPTLITVGGRTAFRHTVSNVGAVLDILRRRRHEVALAGHTHAVERIAHEVEGRPTRFHQVSGVIGAPTVAGLRFRPGVTLYTVRDGRVDDGRFLPLGPPQR